MFILGRTASNTTIHQQHRTVATLGLLHLLPSLDRNRTVRMAIDDVRSERLVGPSVEWCRGRPARSFSHSCFHPLVPGSGLPMMSSCFYLDWTMTGTSCFRKIEITDPTPACDATEPDQYSLGDHRQSKRRRHTAIVSQSVSWSISWLKSARREEDH